MSHQFTVTAVERERNANLFTIVAADLEAILALAGGAVIGGNASVVTSLLGAFAIPLEQQDMHLRNGVRVL